MGEAKLYQESDFFFTKSVASQENCGEITYRLIDEDTGQELTGPVFTINNLSGSIPFM